MTNKEVSRSLSDTSAFDGKSEKESEPKKEVLGKLSGKLAISYTCKVCGKRNEMKMMSRKCYEEGVVIVKCDGCGNNHLIADNLGWFSDTGNKINIETLMEQKGEQVTREVMLEKVDFI